MSMRGLTVASKWTGFFAGDPKPSVNQSNHKKLGNRKTCDLKREGLNNAPGKKLQISTGRRVYPQITAMPVISDISPSHPICDMRLPPNRNTFTRRVTFPFHTCPLSNA
jgi:hypothetical protein